MFPIDYANACPDVAITSLHYYFPWAMKALLKWTLFCLLTDRGPRLATNYDAYFAIADRDDLDYADKLAHYRSSPTTTSTPSATPTCATPGCGTSTRSRCAGSPDPRWIG